MQKFCMMLQFISFHPPSYYMEQFLIKKKALEYTWHQSCSDILTPQLVLMQGSLSQFKIKIENKILTFLHHASLY